MAEARELRKHDRVVRPIAAAGGRTCARPGCPAIARATLVFVYDAKTARLVGLLPERDPAAYDLCSTHADRTSPPFGWSLADERPPDGEERPVDLADQDRTVEVISAALRAVPAPAHDPAPADATGRPTTTAGVDAGRTGGPASAGARTPEPTETAQTPVGQTAPEVGGSGRSVGRPVLAARGDADDDAAIQDGSGDVAIGDPADGGSVATDPDTRALFAAAEQLAGAGIEVALEELTQLDAVAAARVSPRDAEPEVWRLTVEGDPDESTAPLTVPFEGSSEGAEELDLDDDLDDFDEDAVLTPEGAAQLW